MTDNPASPEFSWESAEHDLGVPPLGITPESTAGEEGPDPGPPPPELVTCWRCDKAVEKALEFCTYCRARLVREPIAPSRANRVQADADTTALMRILWVFVGLLVTSIIYGAVVHFGLKDNTLKGQDLVGRQLVAMFGAEVVDTILIGLALLWVARPPAASQPGLVVRKVTWTAAIPALAVVLGANHGYHLLLRGYLAAPPVRDELLAETGLSAWIIGLHCVQPAIVEELFFRYLALGTLRRTMGIHAAVWVSSVMFGLAHIGVPLSIPMLALIGLALGYARVASGSLVLPILMHFLHNTAVLFINT